MEHFYETDKPRITGNINIDETPIESYSTWEPSVTNQSEGAHPFQAQVISFSILMSSCICLTVIGNVLVILSVFTYKPLRSVQNIYIVSLACADLTVAVLVMPFHVANYAFDERWAFGAVFCNVWLTADILACTASILNLCGIALDRYKAIHDPINYAQRRSRGRVLGNLAGIWLVSILISVPPLIGWNNSAGRSLYDATRRTCQLTDDRSFVLYSAAGSFYIPLVVMTFVYANIYRATRARLLARRATCCAAPGTKSQASCGKIQIRAVTSSAVMSGGEAAVVTSSISPLGKTSDLKMRWTKDGREMKRGESERMSRDEIQARRLPRPDLSTSELSSVIVYADKESFLAADLRENLQKSNCESNINSTNECNSLTVMQTKSYSAPKRGRNDVMECSEFPSFERTRKRAFTIGLLDSSRYRLGKEKQIGSCHSVRKSVIETSFIEEKSVGLICNDTNLCAREDMSLESLLNSSTSRNGSILTNASPPNATTNKFNHWTNGASNNVITEDDGSSITNVSAQDKKPENDYLLPNAPCQNSSAESGSLLASTCQLKNTFDCSLNYENPLLNSPRKLGYLRGTSTAAIQQLQGGSPALNIPTLPVTQSLSLECAARHLSTSAQYLNLPPRCEHRHRNSDSTTTAFHSSSLTSADSRVVSVLLIEGYSRKNTAVSASPSRFLREKQRISLTKERRIAHTMAIIMVAFVVCWTPFFLTYVILPFCAPCAERFDKRFQIFVVWLGYVNSTINPVIYTIFNVDFRRAFVMLLRPGARLGSRN